MNEIYLASVDQFIILAQVLGAMFLGALIGMEREAANKPAGLRTHTLVAGAAALIVALGDVLIDKFTVEAGANLIQTDPIRLVEAVVTGVSFLGAGTIFRSSSKDSVEGLTTAASILLASVVGISVALHKPIVACGTVILAVIVLRLMDSLGKHVKQNI